jgi:hypothetical protein
LSRALEVLRWSLRQNRGIRASLVFMVLMLVVSLAALPFDRRQILGLNPWIKPVKFELSMLVFLVTVAVLLWGLGPEVGAGGRWAQSRMWMDWGFGISMAMEIVVIALQAARGVRSHMNFDTPLDTGLFATMGVFILLNTLMGAWLLVLWCRTQAGLDAAVFWGIRLGLFALLAGSIEGVRMVSNGGHTVGAADGLQGLAFVNWSTRFGDLRVAHFFALHALQIFPLVGLALASTKWRTGVQVSGVFGFAVVYFAGLWWMFAQAMRGIPLVRL